MPNRRNLGPDEVFDIFRERQKIKIEKFTWMGRTVGQTFQNSEKLQKCIF